MSELNVALLSGSLEANHTSLAFRLGDSVLPRHSQHVLQQHENTSLFESWFRHYFDVAVLLQVYVCINFLNFVLKHFSIYCSVKKLNSE